jgi:hypothetical protein
VGDRLCRWAVAGATLALAALVSAAPARDGAGVVGRAEASVDTPAALLVLLIGGVLILTDRRARPPGTAGS